MTNEEVILILQELWRYKQVKYKDYEVRTALDMAIQALSQEPCTDAVSREAVNNLYDMYRPSLATHVSEFGEVLKALPSVNPQPCDDAISREDAVHALRKALWDYEDKTEKQFRERDDLDYEEWYFHRIFVQAMNDEDVEAICKLPSVTQKSAKWIPVSERLPEEAFGCLVTILDTDLRTQDEFENILPYFVGYDGETWNNADGEPIPFEVIAWQSLPKPYEPQESEDKE